MVPDEASGTRHQNACFRHAAPPLSQFTTSVFPYSRLRSDRRPALFGSSGFLFLCQDQTINLHEARVITLGVVPRFVLRASLLAHAAQQFLIPPQSFHLCRQVFRITAAKMQAGTAVVDQICGTAGVTRENRQSASERFGNDQWKSFVPDGREDEQ